MNEAPQRISAGIVVYHPEEAQLARLVGAVAPGLREIVIFANSDISDEFEATLGAASAPVRCRIVRPGRNVGLGVAYDAFVQGAREARDRFVFFLDQDSMPPEGAVGRLAALHDRLIQSGERPAVVGPRPIDPEGRPMRIAGSGAPPPSSLEGEATRVDFVISSGSLINVAGAAAVGPFRGDYFIDAIDLEWCFRAGSLGYSIWVADNVAMDHRLGRGVIRLPIVGLLLADQPPRRLYTYLRNQIAMLRLAHVPVAHKIRTVLSLPVRIPVYLVRNSFSRDCRAAIWNGLRDGVTGRLGPPDDALR